MKFPILSACAVAAGFSLLSTSAFAQSITLNLDSVVSSSPIYSGHAGNGGPGNDGNFGPAVTGLANFTVTAQSPLNYPTSLSLFCVEIAQNILLPSTGNVFDVLGADQAAQWNGVGPSHSMNISAGGIGGLRAHRLEVLYAHVFGSFYDPSSLSDGDRASFQMAVWELSHDSDFNLLSGSGNGFWITTPADGTIANAQALVSWVGANFSTAAVMSLSALHSPTNLDPEGPALQDFLIPSESTAFSPIPEPSVAATALGAAVLLGVLGLRGRTCRRNALTANLGRKAGR